MDYTIKDLEHWNSNIEGLVEHFNLECYEQEFEIISYKDMLDYEAYVGMPSRYPHWSFGKAYEKNRTMYQYNLTGLPYEMVINSDPCLAYLMKENTLLLQILTIAHVYGHNDFFKNNRLFRQGTRARYTIEMFKTHANLIRSYIKDPSIGYDSVERVLNAAHAIKLQLPRVVGGKKADDERLKRELMDEYKRKSEYQDVLKPYEKPVPPDLAKIPFTPEEDILGFIAQYGDLEEWERNIIEVVRKETEYFVPQIETKIMNEGWASYWHYNILNELKLPQELHLEFIKRHNDVITPLARSLNPYYLGFKIFEDIERRFGREKLFEVRLLERDESFIRRYLTMELCSDMNLFEYMKKGYDYVVENVSDEEGWTEIRNTLCSTCGMGMVPLIRVEDMSPRDKTLTLQQVYDGRELNMDYAEETIKYISKLWGHTVVLNSRFNDTHKKIICEDGRAIRYV